MPDNHDIPRVPWYLVAFANSGSSPASINPLVIPYDDEAKCREAATLLELKSPWWCAVCIPGWQDRLDLRDLSDG